MLTPAELFLDQAEASPHVQFLYDLTAGRVVFVNAAYERVLQGNCAHVNHELPALLARLHPDDQPVWRAWWRLWATGQFHHEVEFRLLVAGQPEQWFCLTPHRCQDGDGRVWLAGSLADISVGKRHQANSEKFNTKKNTVLEMLAHDLAGTFALLQQLTDFVAEEMSPQANPQVAEMLRLMRATSGQGVRLIHDLVNQELAESASVDLKRERVDVAERVVQALEPHQRLPGRTGRQLRWEVPDAPVYAEVDANKLLQVVTNLVHNAYKFTPEGGRIAVKVVPCAGCVRISIADEGIGIPAHLQAGLFERYTTARRPGLRGEPTTGLGLWLCKTIVELHHGTLTVASTEGQGSTFTVEIPQAERMAD